MPPVIHPSKKLKPYLINSHNLPTNNFLASISEHVYVLFCFLLIIWIWNQIYGRTKAKPYKPGVHHQSVPAAVRRSSFHFPAAQFGTARGKNEHSGPAEPESEITRPRFLPLLFHSASHLLSHVLLVIDFQ